MHFMELKKRILKHKNLGLDRPFLICPAISFARAPMSNFLPLYNTTFFLSSQEAFQIFFCQFFSPLSSLCGVALASNFYICQILINQLQNQLHRLGLSNFKPATKPATFTYCQILSQLQKLEV